MSQVLRWISSLFMIFHKSPAFIIGQVRWKLIMKRAFVVWRSTAATTEKSPLKWTIRWICTLTGKGHYLCNVTTHVLTLIRTYAQTMCSCHRHRNFQFETRENWANFTVKIWYHIGNQQDCPLGESTSKIWINLNQWIEYPKFEKYSGRC